MLHISCRFLQSPHFPSIALPVLPASMSNTTDSQNLAIIVRELRRFNPDTEPSSHQLDQQMTLARSIIRFLDQTSLLQRTTHVQDQVLIISLLQDLAYHDPDSGAIFDIAQWCVRHWLRLLQQYPEDIGVLQGWFLHYFRGQKEV